MIKPTAANVSAWLLAEFCIHCGGVADSPMLGHCFACRRINLPRDGGMSMREWNLCCDWRKKLFKRKDWPVRGIDYAN
jgi:hypothetical protein